MSKTSNIHESPPDWPDLEKLNLFDAVNQFLVNGRSEIEATFLLTKVIVLAINAQISKFRHARRLVACR
jgi:hypothetical protein